MTEPSGWQSSDTRRNTTYRGYLVDANPQDPFTAYINVDKKGKIRDLRVWVEFVNRSRTPADTKTGLQGLQMALISPNTRFFGAYPIWNAPGAQNFLYDANPNLTGTDNLVGTKYQRRIPTVFQYGAYALWDGHKANPAIDYATTALGLTGDWHEFDTDIDMRTIFSDASDNYNPRSRIRVFPSATDIAPGAASNLSATLVYDLKPLSYYYSPSNFAQRNYSGTFDWTGASASLAGAGVPWFVDPLLPSGSLKTPIVGAPPDGWVTGEPNGLFGYWMPGVSSSGQGEIHYAYVSDSYPGSYTPVPVPAGTSQFPVKMMGFSQTLPNVGQVIKIGSGSNEERVVFQGWRIDVNTSLAVVGSSSIITNNEWVKMLISPATALSHSPGEKIYTTNGTTYQPVAGMTSAVQFRPELYSYYYPPGHYTGYVGMYNTNFVSPVGPGSPVPSMMTSAGFVSGAVFSWCPNGYPEQSQSFHIKNIVYPYDWYPSRNNLGGEGSPVVSMLIQTDEPLATDRMDIATILTSTYGWMTATTSNVVAGMEGGEYGLNTYGLGNRWGYSALIEPEVAGVTRVLLLGGYTGSLAAPVSANFVDVVHLVKTGSSAYISSTFRSGTVAGPIRLHGDAFTWRTGDNSKYTFYLWMGGGVTGTIAITGSADSTISTAQVASTVWSNPYSYQYWREAVYYDNTPPDYPPPDTCLDPETPVLVDRYSMVPIGSLKMGDKVWTVPFSGGDFGHYIVDAIAPSTNLRCRVIFKDGRDFVSSINHLINVKGIWRRADSLQPGEEIQGHPSGYVDRVEYLGEGPVIKISIRDAMTYFAGNGCWHHNRMKQY